MSIKIQFAPSAGIVEITFTNRKKTNRQKTARKIYPRGEESIVLLLSTSPQLIIKNNDKTIASVKQFFTNFDFMS